MSLNAEGCRTRQTRLLQNVEADRIIINNPRHIQYLWQLIHFAAGAKWLGPQLSFARY